MATTKQYHLLVASNISRASMRQMQPKIKKPSPCPLPMTTGSVQVRCWSNKSRSAQTTPGRPIMSWPTNFPSQKQPTSQYSTEKYQASSPVIHDVFESKTGSWQYVVADPVTLNAVIIDPVLDYDPITNTVETKTADSLLALVKENGYTVDRILETHAHADHMTAASYIQRQILDQQGHRPLICIGSRIGQVQKRFSGRYSIPTQEYSTVFDELLDDDEEFLIGNLKATAIHVPGHTPDHMGYKIGSNIFSGDLIFHKDLGTARADFPGGSASQIFRSAQKILSYPENVRIWAGHDYPPEGREAVSSMTVKEHRNQNKHLMDGLSEEEFIKLRQARDAELAAPKLLHQSLQINVRGGKLPVPNDSGQRVLHLPLRLGRLSW